MEFTVRTNRREELVDITPSVARAAAEAGDTGVLHVFVPHTTCGVTINENADPDVQSDLLEGLRRIAPADARYRHFEGNSDAHIKSSLVGVSLLVAFADGRLELGRWQGIYLCEFDGPRSRRVEVRVVCTSGGGGP